MFDIPNMDAFIDPADLDAIANNAEAPESIRMYATEKAIAMRARLDGDINTALQHEKNCDQIYDNLTEDERTW